MVITQLVRLFDGDRKATCSTTTTYSKAEPWTPSQSNKSYERRTYLITDAQSWGITTSHARDLCLTSSASTVLKKTNMPLLGMCMCFKAITNGNQPTHHCPPKKHFMHGMEDKNAILHLKPDATTNNNKGSEVSNEDLFGNFRKLAPPSGTLSP